MVFAVFKVKQICRVFFAFFLFSAIVVSKSIVLCFRGKMSSVQWLLVAMCITSYTAVSLGAVTCLDNHNKPVDWSVDMH